MSSSCTPILVGVASPVSEILLLFCLPSRSIILKCVQVMHALSFFSTQYRSINFFKNSDNFSVYDEMHFKN